MTTKRHLTYMIITGAAVLVGLWAFGVSLSAALLYAFLLVCPLMMVFMMRGMDHGGMDHGGMNHGGMNHGAPDDGEHRHQPTSGDVRPAPDAAQLRGIDEQYRR